MNTPKELTEKTVKSERAFNKLNDNEKAAWLWNYVACGLETLNETTVSELKYQIDKDLCSFEFETNDGYSGMEEGYFPFDMGFEDIVAFLEKSDAKESVL